jgi:hypothetical protein
MAEKKTFSDSLLRTVALLGLLLVLLLGAWGIILLVLNLSSIAGSVGGNITSLFAGTPSGTAESLTVSAPSSVVSGQSFTLSWNHVNATGAHSYTVSYSCQSGLTVKAPTSAGQYQAVSCNTPFNYTNATNQMPLIATVSKGATIPATFTVSAVELDNNAVTASNSATVSVGNGAQTAATSPSTAASGSSGASSTYVPAATRAALYGYADLAVTILSVTPPTSYQSLATVQFEIQNVGTNVASSGWSFNVQLPLNPVYTYTATAQQALYPGDKIIYTLSYSEPYTGTYYNNTTYPYQTYPYQQTCYSYNGYQNIPVACTTNSGTAYNYNTNYNYSYGYQNGLITVTADPQNYIYDLNRANNTASIAAPAY